MTAEQVFSIWAPDNSPWSAWVAAVLFAQTYWENRIKQDRESPHEIGWIRDCAPGTAVIVNLPGAESVEVGFALAERGFRPVPLFNASPGPEEVIGLGSASPSPSNAFIDMGPIVSAIGRFTVSLQNLSLPTNAPPAFLLDSMRLAGTRPLDEGLFDNRWMVFPQDFPSANFLRAHAIEQVLLVQKDRLEPSDDLAHVLLRWQQAGIKVFSKRTDDDNAPGEISVKRPSRYKALWYRALAILGLRRSCAGGFGSYIPETSGAG